jgi:hypothetical protein
MAMTMATMGLRMKNFEIMLVPLRSGWRRSRGVGLGGDLHAVLELIEAFCDNGLTAAEPGGDDDPRADLCAKLDSANVYGAV